MRGATECTKRLKPFFSALRSKLGKVGPLTATDPITQLILGVLSRDTPETKAQEGLERLRAVVVDYNELRVVPPIELAGLLGDFPDARLKCEDISRALNAVFGHEHAISLERLAAMSKRDAQAALEKIDGLEAYTRARIRLLGLRQHAIPLDEAMWALARQEGLVDPRCPLQEAQQFLERAIREDDALEFVALLKKYAWSEMGTAVRRREVERIVSVPPDRTARNMLQMVSSSLAEELEDADESVEEARLPRPAQAEPGQPATPRSSATRSRRAARSPTTPTKAPKAAGRARAPSAARSGAGRKADSRKGPTRQPSKRVAPARRATSTPKRKPRLRAAN